jgi:hypothetical protein
MRRSALRCDLLPASKHHVRFSTAIYRVAWHGHRDNSMRGNCFWVGEEGRCPGGVDSVCVLRARVDSAGMLEMGRGRGSGSNAYEKVLYGSDGGGHWHGTLGGSGGTGAGFERATRVVLAGVEVGVGVDVGRRGRSTIRMPHSLHPSGGLGAEFQKRSRTGQIKRGADR